MGWTDISDSSFDADSPITDTLMQQIVENGEYNHDHAIRGGTNAAGVRLALSRHKSSEFTISMDANGNGSVGWDITVANATDGAPNFANAPVPVGFMCEDSGGGASAWGNGAVYSVKLVSSSTTTVSTRIAVVNGPASTTIKGYLYVTLLEEVTSGE